MFFKCNNTTTAFLHCFSNFAEAIPILRTSHRHTPKSSSHHTAVRVTPPISIPQYLHGVGLSHSLPWLTLSKMAKLNGITTPTTSLRCCLIAVPDVRPSGCGSLLVLTLWDQNNAPAPPPPPSSPSYFAPYACPSALCHLVFILSFPSPHLSRLTVYEIIILLCSYWRHLQFSAFSAFLRPPLPTLFISATASVAFKLYIQTTASSTVLPTTNTHLSHLRTSLHPHIRSPFGIP